MLQPNNRFAAAVCSELFAVCCALCAVLYAVLYVPGTVRCLPLAGHTYPHKQAMHTALGHQDEQRQACA